MGATPVLAEESAYQTRREGDADPSDHLLYALPACLRRVLGSETSWEAAIQLICVRLLLNASNSHSGPVMADRLASELCSDARNRAKALVGDFDRPSNLEGRRGRWSLGKGEL